MWLKLCKMVGGTKEYTYPAHIVSNTAIKDLKRRLLTWAIWKWQNLRKTRWFFWNFFFPLKTRFFRNCWWYVIPSMSKPTFKNERQNFFEKSIPQKLAFNYDGSTSFAYYRNPILKKISTNFHSLGPFLKVSLWCLETRSIELKPVKSRQISNSATLIEEGGKSWGGKRPKIRCFHEI